MRESNPEDIPAPLAAATNTPELADAAVDKLDGDGLAGRGTLGARRQPAGRRPQRACRLIAGLALVGALLATLGSLTGPVSSASATTWSRDNDYLHFPPWRPHHRECRPTRSLALNGTYRWRAYTKHWAHRTEWHQRFPSLRGQYYWFVCRQHIAGKGYRIDAQLANKLTGGRVFLKHSWYGGWYGDGSYEWGSSLDRVGPFGR